MPTPTRPRLAIAAALAGLALSAPALGAPSPSAAPDPAAPLVIAVESPQSGVQASNGLDMLRGVRLAARQVNAHGGVLGRQVQVFAADDTGDSAVAQPLARRVIAKGIRFVIGPYNSSVGLENLPLYRRSGVLPVWMTSSDETRGAGATVQPMNSQIAPIESRYVASIGAKRVTMLVDDTPDGAFTAGMANRLARELQGSGTVVTRIPIKEIAAPDGSRAVPRDYFAGVVAQALATSPDLIYVSSYFPEGVEIAAALAAVDDAPRCLMGLANVDNGFLAQATLAQAQRCVFSGVVAAGQMPSARGYVQQYRRAFDRRPGVWGSFTYDSARILFAAIERAGSDRFGAVATALRATSGFRGATGTISIDRTSGYRTAVPVEILTVNARKKFTISE
jgi:ABC-type branched-subunit amino acid transport system substrate-binding protein